MACRPASRREVGYTNPGGLGQLFDKKMEGPGPLQGDLLEGGLELQGVKAGLAPIPSPWRGEAPWLRLGSLLLPVTHHPYPEGTGKGEFAS